MVCSAMIDTTGLVIIFMDTKAKIARAKERVIESIAINMDLYGVTPSVGRLYGTMFFHGAPMTLDDMKESLQMSKTSMSTGIKTLMDLNCVEKVWNKGARKDLYQTKDDWQQIFLDYFSIQWRKAVHTNLDALQKSKAELLSVVNDLRNNTSSESVSQRAHTGTPFEKASFEDAKGTTQDIEEALEMLQKINFAIAYYTWLNTVINAFEQKEFFDTLIHNSSTKETS